MRLEFDQIIWVSTCAPVDMGTGPTKFWQPKVTSNKKNRIKQAFFINEICSSRIKAPKWKYFCQHGHSTQCFQMVVKVAVQSKLQLKSDFIEVKLVPYASLCLGNNLDQFFMQFWVDWCPLPCSWHKKSNSPILEFKVLQNAFKIKKKKTRLKIFLKV